MCARAPWGCSQDLTMMEGKPTGSSSSSWDPVEIPRGPNKAPMNVHEAHWIPWGGFSGPPCFQKCSMDLIGAPTRPPMNLHEAQCISMRLIGFHGDPLCGEVVAPVTPPRRKTDISHPTAREACGGGQEVGEDFPPPIFSRNKHIISRNKQK